VAIIKKIVVTVPRTLCSTLASVWLRLAISSRMDLRSAWKNCNTTTFLSLHYLHDSSPLAVEMFGFIDLN